MDRNDRAIVGLVMLAHAMVHTYELSVPIFIGYWLGAFEVTEASIGVVVTVGYAAFGLGALPGGVLADAVGSRRLIAACLLGMGGSFLVLSQAGGLLTIAVALLLWGVAASVYHPSGLALISKGVRERGSGFAYHGMAGNLGIAVGPLVTSLLLIAFDWRVVAAVLSVPAVVAAAYAVWVDVDETAAVDAPETATDGGEDDESDSRAESVESLGEFVDGTTALFSGAFALVFLVVVASGLFYRGVLTFLPEILGEFPAFDAVRLAGIDLEPSRYAYVGLLGVGMAGQYVGGRLTDRIYPPVGLAAGFATLATLALVFVPVVETGILGFLVVGTLLGFFLFVVQPLYQATVAELTPAGTRGLSYGYTYLGVFGVGALGGAVAGFVLTRAGDTALFGVLALIAAAGSAVGIVLSRRRSDEDGAS